MAGLYIHIPFCKQKCHYCNFFSVASQKHKNEIFSALLTEMEIQKFYLNNEPLETIYFGGGTPSLFQPAQIQKIIEKAQLVFGLGSDPEITLEANPDDISRDWLMKLKQTTVNRLSIGVQSFDDRDLKYLNRIHSANEAITAVTNALNFGFENLSIDLIYGIPTLENETWLKNLHTALNMHIPHISSYALTVEPGTALDLLIRKGKYEKVNEGNAVSHFGMLMEFVEKNGYDHYEISNFALPGRYARHNTAYWQGSKYLGIGPSAHSFNLDSRQWNIAGITQYLDGINAGKLKFEIEFLNQVQRINEYIMTSLRTMWGMDLMKIEKNFGANYRIRVENELSPHQKSGHISINNGVIYLTSKGKLFADRIASDLFVDA